MVLLPIKIRFVHGQGIDEMLDFPVGIDTKLRKIRCKRRRTCCSHAIQNPSFDVITLGFSEDDACIAIKKFAKPPKLFLRGRMDGVHAEEAGETALPPSPMR